MDCERCKVLEADLAVAYDVGERDQEKIDACEALLRWVDETLRGALIWEGVDWGSRHQVEWVVEHAAGIIREHRELRRLVDRAKHAARRHRRSGRYECCPWCYREAGFPHRADCEAAAIMGWERREEKEGTGT